MVGEAPCSQHYFSLICGILNRLGSRYCALITVVSGKYECTAHGEKPKKINHLKIVELEESRDNFTTQPVILE